MAIDSTLLTAAAASATNFSPLLTSVGFGGLVGFLIGFVIKKLFKILAIIAGVFFAVLIYLEQQVMVNINWDKINMPMITARNKMIGNINTKRIPIPTAIPVHLSSLLAEFLLSLYL